MSAPPASSRFQCLFVSCDLQKLAPPAAFELIVVVQLVADNFNHDQVGEVVALQYLKTASNFFLGCLFAFQIRLELSVKSSDVLIDFICAVSLDSSFIRRNVDPLLDESIDGT